MRRGWISVWMVSAAGLGLGRCAIDDRSPQQVVASNLPGGDADSRSAQGADAGATDPANGTGGTGDATNGGNAGGMSGGAGSPGSAGAGPGSAGQSGSAGASGGSAGASGGSAGASGTAGPVDSIGASGSDGIDGLLGPGDSTKASPACTGFNACGGELAGRWSYTDVCIEPEQTTVDLLQILCTDATLEYERRSGSTLTFADAQVTRAGAPVGDGVITFPSTCTADLGGCSQIAVAFAGAECAELNGACICRTPGAVDWGTQSYTVDGAQLRLGDGRSFDYCVEGARLTYHETGNAVESGTYTLQHD